MIDVASRDIRDECPRCQSSEHTLESGRMGIVDGVFIAEYTFRCYICGGAWDGRFTARPELKSSFDERLEALDQLGARIEQVHARLQASIRRAELALASSDGFAQALACLGDRMRASGRRS